MVSVKARIMAIPFLLLCVGGVARSQTRSAGVSSMWNRKGRGPLPAPGSVIAHASGPPLFSINTVVGDGHAGYSGDGGAATDARINQPLGVALDGVGDLYIADWGNNVVRVVTPDGTIGTVAGNGRAGYNGDGGPATEAALNAPNRVSVDGQGNLYISDSRNNRIRMVSPDGTITTVAGNGHAGFTGDGGLATSAELNFPCGTTSDVAGNLYIADGDNNRIRMVSTDGTITTFAGTGQAGYKGDGGAAVDALLRGPVAVSADISGDLLISDQGNSVIRQVTNGIITTVAGTGQAGYSGDGGQGTLAQLNNPAAMMLDSVGNLFIADRDNNAIRVLLPDGTIYTVAGDGRAGYGGDGGPALDGGLYSPREAAIDGAGDVYIADCYNNRIRILTPALSTPAISGTVVSASAFGGFQAVAPGSWIEIYGNNLAADTRQWSGSDFNGNEAPTSLDGTYVTIGGQSAFVYYISPGQVDAQVPSNVALGQQPITVTNTVGTSDSYTITVNAAEPGLLAPSSFVVGGTQYVVALFPDGVTYVLPPGAIAGVNSKRASPGDTIVLYGVGFGPVTPNIPAGEVVQQSNTLANSFEMSIGGQPATLSYSGLAPQYVGLYQFNVVVPNIAASDMAPVTFQLGSVNSPQTLYLAVGN